MYLRLLWEPELSVTRRSHVPPVNLGATDLLDRKCVIKNVLRSLTRDELVRLVKVFVLYRDQNI